MAKVRKRRFNFKRFFKFIFILITIIVIYSFISNKPIKNIIIKGNDIISDEEIIETSKLESYPSYIKTSSRKIKNRLLKNPLIEEVKIKKKWNYRIVIEVKEHKVLFKERSTNEIILNGNIRVSDLNINSPILINYVPNEILDKFVSKLETVDQNIINKISEIEYSPTNYDKERFILYMVDENIVYITLNKIKEFNSYTKIKEQLGTHKGILYLDSGNYFEIKDK